MTVWEDLNKWAALLPLQERMPTRLKVSPTAYHKLVETATYQPINSYKDQPKFGPVQVDLDTDLECDWIMYDQHGEEMKRSE